MILFWRRSLWILSLGCLTASAVLTGSCNSSGSNAPCQTSRECGGRLPICDRGSCVACVSNADCPDAKRPVCDPGRGCLGCLANADCGLGFCNTLHECV